MTIRNRQLGSILLIAGTCVGAGMLVLPVVSAPAGFIAAVALLIACWFAMYISGLLLVEANLWLPEGSSFVSMARRTLGPIGAAIVWLFYLLLLYSLIAAYLTGGGGFLTGVISHHFSINVSHWLAPIPWVLVIGYVIYSGTKQVDGLNRFFIVGLLVSFSALLVLLLPHIRLSHLVAMPHYHKPSQLFYALPIVNAAFGFHAVLPSVRDYLRSHQKQLRVAVFWGSFIPLLIYLVWSIGVFCIIPFSGAHGLHSILLAGHPQTDLSHAVLLIWKNKWLSFCVDWFVFFALASSFIAIALSLFDFLADGFRIKKTPVGRLKLTLLTLLPPYLYAVLYSQGFILALSYAGVFVALLGILLPTVMVGVGRNRGLSKGYKVSGGWFTLLVMIAVAIGIVAAHFMGRVG